jgi:hypothetical protein
MIRSPLATPLARSQLATWFERADSSAKVQCDSLPSGSTIQSFEIRPGYRSVTR